MSLVLNTEGEKLLLNSAINYYAADPSLKFGLYTNDYTPTRSVSAADLTEATGGGYAQQQKTSSGWNSAVSGNPSYATTTTPVTFTFTSVPTPDTMYGWFLLSSSGAVLGAERFSSPLVINAPYASIALNAKIQLLDERDLNSELAWSFGNAAEQVLVDGITSKQGLEHQFNCFLFSNDYALNESMVIGDFTLILTEGTLFESFFSSQGTLGLTASPESIASLAGGSWVGLTMNSVSTTVTSYGYLVRDGLSRLLGAARFPAPLSIVPGMVIDFAPAFTLRDRNYTP